MVTAGVYWVPGYLVIGSLNQITSLGSFVSAGNLLLSLYKSHLILEITKIAVSLDPTSRSCAFPQRENSFEFPLTFPSRYHFVPTRSSGLHSAEPLSGLQTYSSDLHLPAAVRAIKHSQLSFTSHCVKPSLLLLSLIGV